MPSENNPGMSVYFKVNFIRFLIALSITQSARHDYSSANDINDTFVSLQVLCHVVDLKHGFYTRREKVLFTSENIETYVKIT